MSIPDFDRAEYTQPQPPSAYADVLPPSPYTSAAPPPASPVHMSSNSDRYATASDHFAKSVALGAGAALVGALGYGLIGLSGWMVSIVSIGVGWLVARAMMTGSLGIGGRKFQVVAVLLTYFACGAGHVLDIFWFTRADLAHHSFVYLFLYAATAIAIGPFVLRAANRLAYGCWWTGLWFQRWPSHHAIRLNRAMKGTACPHAAH